MSERSIKVQGYIEQEEKIGFDSFDAKTTSVITVEPPIIVYEGFKSVVLGRDNERAGVKGVISTPEMTVLIATATGAELTDRHADIDTIAQRIGQLVTDPARAAAMLAETPFADEPSSMTGYY